jgi:chorismate mutase
MVLVHNKHRVDIDEPLEFSQVDVLRDLLESFEKRESVVVEEIFRRRLMEVVNAYHPQKMVEEPRPELDRFKDYLFKANEQMYYEIVNFMDKYGNLSDTQYSEFQEWLLSPLKRENDETNVKDNLYKTSQQCKNTVYVISKLLPQMILDQKIYNKIPEHWDLAGVHRRDLDNFQKKYWDKIPSFFGDKVLQQLLIEVRERLNDIYLLITELPTYTPIIKENHEFHSLFDTQTSYFIFIYLVYSVFYEYIVCSNNPDLLYTDLIETKKQRKQPVNLVDELTTINVTSEEDMDELDDIQIEMGNQEELKKRVAKLLLTFVDLENENQAYFVSYKEIMKKVGISRKQEKKRITDYLGSLQEDERQIEKLFEKYKMGRWNAGMQKGLVHYDKATYERQREESMTGQFLGDMGNAGSSGDTVEDLEREIEREAVAEQDNEGNDYRAYDDNYQDGVIYEEDRDHDDFE